MVNFLRDVMIVVAVLATFIALAFYPSHETGAGTTSVKHDIPIGVPPLPAGTPTASVDVVTPKFDQHTPR